jgi:hypothetical protein
MTRRARPGRVIDHRKKMRSYAALGALGLLASVPVFRRKVRDQPNWRVAIARISSRTASDLVEFSARSMARARRAASRRLRRRFIMLMVAPPQVFGCRLAAVPFYYTAIRRTLPTIFR